MKDYYGMLEIEPGSSVEEIKQAYRRLAKQYHPDINKSNGANQKFIDITEAYEVLLHEAAAPKPETRSSRTDDYEEFIREVREAAQRQARMRYEKFARQHEAFQESGLYDAMLILKFLGRIILPFFALGLISVPVVVSLIAHSFFPFFYLFIFWVIGCFLLFDVFQKRKGYFKVGKFYYSFQKIAQKYTQTNDTALQECTYCKGLKANSHAYRISLLRMKDIRLTNKGPLQHHANYDRKEIQVTFPRSQKAFVIHSISSLVKIVSINFSLVFFPVDSFLWRFIAGIVAGSLLTWLLSVTTQTRSKSGFLVSYGFLIKVVIWLTVFVLLSHFKFHPFNIRTSEFIRFSLFIMLFADSFLEQLIKLPKNVHLFKPLPRQYKSLEGYFNQNYQLYLEIPVWTIVYPFLRWIF